LMARISPFQNLITYNETSSHTTLHLSPAAHVTHVDGLMPHIVRESYM
jgi:hypothetical protein